MARASVGELLRSGPPSKPRCGSGPSGCVTRWMSWGRRSPSWPRYIDRTDLLPKAVIDELATLQERVTPLSEAEVVAAMERELGVPWEDVFASIDRIRWRPGRSRKSTERRWKAASGW